MSSPTNASRGPVRAWLALALALAACRSGGSIADEPRPFGNVREESPVVALPAGRDEASEPPEVAASAASSAPSSSAAPTNDPEPAEPTQAPPSAPHTGEAAREAAHAEHARDTATQAPPNRDKKGETDVARYIQRLESAERERELKVDVVLARMELPTDAIIGDLGCGPGIFSIAFANACPEGVVYASDIEPAQIDHVRTKADERGLRNVIPVLASANDPHFPLAQLDFVFIADTYHHLEERVEYMRRLKDVLKPGGKIVLLEYKPGTIPVGPPADHKLPAGVMDKEMEQAGYVLIDRFATHAWHDFEIWRRVHSWERR